MSNSRCKTPSLAYYRYTTPRENYLFLLWALMHLAQAKTLFPLKSLTHWRLGYFLLLAVGLYLPLSFVSFQAMVDDFLQIEHCFDIWEYAII